MDKEFYETSKIRMAALRALYRTQLKTRPDYGRQWTYAMSGEGGIVPDELVWKKRYEELAEENRILRTQLCALRGKSAV